MNRTQTGLCAGPSSRATPKRQCPRCSTKTPRKLSITATIAEQAQPTSQQPIGAPLVSPTKCLKEWNVTIEALGNGEQTVLFRKGGIKEPTFRPEAGTFLLFPTAFHTEQQLLKPGVAERYQQAMALDPKAQTSLTLPYVAQVTGAWATPDSGVLAATHPLHVWTEAFIETRLKWRSRQPITVLELRCWRLARPVELPLADSMFGCFSWVDVGGLVQPDLSGATPCVDDATFAARQVQLREALAGLEVQPLELP